MLREAINDVYIEGLLSEVNTIYKSFVRDGKNVDAITGDFKVLVEREEDGEIDANEILVKVFAPKYTKSGNINPSFESLDSLKDYTSIAAYGSKEGADRIRVKGGRVRVSTFYGRDGKIKHETQIEGSFVTRVLGDFNPRADFNIEGFISKINTAVDKDGVELDPKTLEVSMVVPGWNEMVQEVPFVVKRPKVVAGIERSYKVGDTVKVAGTVNFNFEKKTITEEVSIGDPIVRTVTVSKKELEIVSGYEPYDTEGSYDVEEIREGMARLKARVEESKNKSKIVPVPQSQTAFSGGMDLGF